MEYKKRKIKLKLKKKYKNFLIIYLVLATIVTGQYSLAKFTTTFSKNSKVSVAKPVVNIVGEDISEVEFVEEEPFKYVATYDFKVTNHKDGSINEVDMQYFIEVNIGEKFSYSLYKDEVKDENLITDIENYSNILGHEVEEEHQYILRIVYEPIESNEAYKETFDVNVLSVQLK